MLEYKRLIDDYLKNIISKKNRANRNVVNECVDFIENQLGFKQTEETLAVSKQLALNFDYDSKIDYLRSQAKIPRKLQSLRDIKENHIKIQVLEKTHKKSMQDNKLSQ